MSSTWPSFGWRVLKTCGLANMLRANFFHSPRTPPRIPLLSAACLVQPESKQENLNTIRKKLSAEPTVVLEWLFFGPGRRQCSEQVHRRRSVSLKHPGSRGWNRGGKTRWGDADVVYQCFNNAGNYSLFLDKVCLLSDQRRIGRTPRTAGEKQALAASQQGSLLRFWNVMTCHSRWTP